MTAWTGSSLRSAALCAALLFSLSGVSLVLHAQTTDPRVVEFAPSPDHDRVVSGVAVVNRYELEFYLLNGLVVLQTIDLGKPNPGTDGIIRAEFSSLLGSWPVLPIFRYLFEQGKIASAEMLRVFNMGIGMVLFVGKDEVDRVVQHFAQIDQKYYFAGNVVKGSGKVVYDTPPSGFASWIE